MTFLLAMLIVVVVSLLLVAIWQGYILSVTGKKLDYYRSRLLKMVANDTLVEESLQILCEAYNVEEEDLRNYISKYQERKSL